MSVPPRVQGMPHVSIVVLLFITSYNEQIASKNDIYSQHLLWPLGMRDSSISHGKVVCIILNTCSDCPHLGYLISCLRLHFLG